MSDVPSPGVPAEPIPPPLPEKKIGEQFQITRVGKTEYGPDQTGPIFPARAISGRTENLRFFAVQADEPPLDPRWKLSESRVVKLVITRERGTDPMQIEPNYEWDLGTREPPRDSETKELADFVASESFEKAIEVFDRITAYKADRVQSLAAREKSREYVTKQAEQSELKRHWEDALARFDELEKHRAKAEPKREPETVERFRENLDTRLAQALNDLGKRQELSQDQELGYER